jgi:hypothetical protein
MSNKNKNKSNQSKAGNAKKPVVAGSAEAGNAKKPVVAGSAEAGKDEKPVEKTEAGKVEKIEAGKVEKTEAKAEKVEKVEKPEAAATATKNVKPETPPVNKTEEKKQLKPSFRGLGLIDHRAQYLRIAHKDENGNVTDKDLNGKLVPEGRLVFVIRTKTNEDQPIDQLPAAPVVYDQVDENGTMVNVAYKEPKIRKQEDGISAFNIDTGKNEQTVTYKQHTVFVEGIRKEKGPGDTMVDIKIGYVGRWNTTLSQADIKEIEVEEAKKLKAKDAKTEVKAQKLKEKEEKIEKQQAEAAATANATKSVTGAADKDTKNDAPTKTEKVEKVIAESKKEVVEAKK